MFTAPFRLTDGPGAPSVSMGRRACGGQAPAGQRHVLPAGPQAATRLPA